MSTHEEIAAPLQALRTLLAPLDSGAITARPADPLSELLWDLADQVRALDTALVARGITAPEALPHEQGERR